MKFNFIFISAYILSSTGVLISNVSAVNGVLVSAMEGDSVTLHTGVRTDQQDRIKWYFNNIRIAQINGNQNKTCTDVQCNGGNERFRDRLKLDHQTGSLTIRNIKTKQAGVYKLQIISSRSREETFNISVHDVAQVDKMKTVLVKEGESVTLDSGVIKKPHDRMIWFFNHTLIAKITGDQIQVCTDDECKERFRDRLTVDHQTGSLTITNTRTEDSLFYELRIINGSTSVIKRFEIVLIDLHVETPASLGYIVLGFPVILASACGIYCLCRKNKRQLREYEVDRLSVVEGESVTLIPDTEIRRKDQIRWISEDENCILAEMKAGANKTQDVAVEKFKDRVKLDKKTGSLTISDIRITDSGVYKVQISKGGKKSMNLFSVSVFVRSVSVMEGDPVELDVGQTETQKADKILWTFGPGSECIAEMNNLAKKLYFYNDALNGKFKYRLRLDEQTGSLTIKETKTTDSGVYELRIISKGKPSLKLFSVSVSGPIINRST